MNWSIENKPFVNAKLMVNIDFQPKNDPLRYFFYSVCAYLSEYPKFLNSFNNTESCYTHNSSMRFYNDLDWEDIKEIEEIGGSIKEDEVVVYHEFYGETVIGESIFTEIVLDYSQHLLDFYKDDSSLPDLWSEEMIKEITKLKNKRDQT